LLNGPRFPRARPLAGRTLSLLTLSAEGFYHFLVEALPRLRLVDDLLPHLDHVLVNGTPGSFQEQWLVHTGVPREKILWAEGLTHYRCEQLLFFGPLIADCQPGAWLRDALQELCRPPRNIVGRRWLWISRKDAASRHLAWEDELLAHFPEFEKVTMGNRPPREQIALFAEASVVAGPHGAGLANLLFAPRGVKLVEFFPNYRIAPQFGRCAQIAGGRAAWAWTDFSHPTDLERLLPPLRDFLG
jgi:capsular polysaccharide biosynthesis protein